MKKPIKTDSNTIVRNLIWGLIAGAAAAFAVMLICALIMTARDLPESAAVHMGTLCIAVGAAIAGFVAALRHKSHGMAVGALTGFALFLLILIASVFASGTSFTIATPIRLLLSVALSSIGGVIGVNFSARRNMI